VIKRNGAIALGSILAVAGCGGGGASTPVAKPAAKTNAPQATGHLTINPSLLRHASSGRRRPKFVDATGNGGELFLNIASVSDDGFVPTVLLVPISVSGAPIQVSVPLYGPGGFIRVQEFNQPLNSVTGVAIGVPQLIANSDNGNFSEQRYDILSGTDVTLPAITLNAVIGGIVVSDTPDGSSLNTLFVPNSSNTFPNYEVNASGFVYAFPADATGGFSNLAIPGGFPNPVTAETAAFGVTASTTPLPGVFFLPQCSGENVTQFTTTDVFGNIGSTRGSDVGSTNVGYLIMLTSCP